MENAAGIGLRSPGFRKGRNGVKGQEIPPCALFMLRRSKDYYLLGEEMKRIVRALL
jgi:hypothetical protein